MNQEMYEEAVRSNILSRQLIEELLNSLDYTGISFINSTIEVLKVIRTRLERGDKITDGKKKLTFMDCAYKRCVNSGACEIYKEACALEEK